jgi:N-acetylglucosamine kinase-like BadF-type ATPase
VAIFLGIDGGGSKTSCLVGDETSILGSTVTAGSNVLRVGKESARQALHEAIRQACAKANITPAHIQCACVGLAGAARPGVRDTVQQILAEVLPGNFEITGDIEIALEAAFNDDPGVIVIAGTGSIAYGRNAQGQTAREGGWGFAISDEGSGYWIGKTAVATVVNEGEDAKDVCLLKMIAKAWSVSTHQQVVVAANSIPSPDFAALFPIVQQAAEKQNKQALKVLIAAGEELAKLAKSVIDRAFTNTDDVRIAMSGGVFAHSPQVREVFYNCLKAEYPKVNLIDRVVEPVLGALQRARWSIRENDV